MLAVLINEYTGQYLFALSKDDVSSINYTNLPGDVQKKDPGMCCLCCSHVARARQAVLKEHLRLRGFV